MDAVDAFTNNTPPTKLVHLVIGNLYSDSRYNKFSPRYLPAIYPLPELDFSSSPTADNAKFGTVPDVTKLPIAQNPIKWGGCFLDKET